MSDNPWKSFETDSPKPYETILISGFDELAREKFLAIGFVRRDGTLALDSGEKISGKAQKWMAIPKESAQ